MRVAFIAPTKSYGGIERTFVTLAGEFAAKGVVATITMLRDSQVPYPDELEESTTVRDLGTRSKRDGLAKVARFVRDERPDVIVTAKDHAAQVVLLARCVYGFKVPVFVTVTNMWSRVVKRPLQRLFVRWLYPKADGIIAVSEGVKSDLCTAFGIHASRVRVIYNPVVSAVSDDSEMTAVPHPWLNDVARVPVVLGVGRLEEQKDFPTLLRAFGRVRERRPCRLLILGEGSRRASLESLANKLGLTDDVAFPGQVASAAPYLRRASLFVLSSRWEGFGIVVAEALAAGIPVVATDCASGPAEILAHGRHGRLVPVGDHAALAAGMQQALDAPVCREDLMRAAERFAPAEVAAAYLEYLRLDGGAHA